jgi:hypothetical protein
VNRDTAAIIARTKTAASHAIYRTIIAASPATLVTPALVVQLEMARDVALIPCVAGSTSMVWKAVWASCTPLFN